MSEAQDHSERETLWVTDAELIRRIGVPEKIARANLRMYDQYLRGVEDERTHLLQRQNRRCATKL